MPRTNLGKKNIINPVEQRKTLNRLIRIAMARKDIRSISRVAALMAMDDSCIGKRMNGDCRWTFDELCRLFRVLEFTPEETAQAMGVVA